MNRWVHGGLLVLVCVAMCGCPADPVAVGPAASKVSPQEAVTPTMEAPAFSAPLMLREAVVPLWLDGREVPFAAFTVLVPEGWSLVGGASGGDPDGLLALTRVDVRVVAPDGRQARVFPAFSFEYHSQPEQPEPFTPLGDGQLYHLPPASIGQWFVETAERFHREGVAEIELIQEARVDAVSESLHALFHEFVAQVRANESVFSGGGSTQTFELYAARAEVGYEENGEPIRETVLANVQRYEVSHPATGTAGSWVIGWMRSLLAPEGVDAVGDPLLQLVVDSLEPTRGYDLETARYWMWMERQQREAAGAPQEMASPDDARKQDLRADRIAFDREALDRCMRPGWRDGGAEDEVLYYTTPSGQVTALPRRYAVVFSDGADRLLLHEDPRYRPGLDDALDASVDWGPLVGREFLDVYAVEVKR